MEHKIRQTGLDSTCCIHSVCVCVPCIENANSLVALNDINAWITEYLNESFQIELIGFDAQQTVSGNDF